MTAGPEEAHSDPADGSSVFMHAESHGFSTLAQIGTQINLLLAIPAAPEVRYSLLPDTAMFTGRRKELDKINAAVDAAASKGECRLPILTIDGMPGVGKTALAVHVAHKLRNHFPDRQLFIDLHAHTPGHGPVRPEDALASLLAAMGLDPKSLPGDLDGRAAMWRDKIAGQRALLLLDNAASSWQVAPLLPGYQGCLVLVTSRRHLSDLPGSLVPVRLDALPPQEAEEMFTRLAPRAKDSPYEVTEVLRLAGFLPLAISLLARVLVRHPSWTMADLLTETQAGLLTLKAEKDSVAAAFEVSYRNLHSDQQRIFRLLSLHPGTTIDSYAAAALVAASLNEAADLLDGLHREGLVTETGFRRYVIHDLLRLYARDLASTSHAVDNQQALDRLLDYYQDIGGRTEARLARQTRPGPAVITVASPHATPAVEHVNGALSWARIERASLLACLDYVVSVSQHTRIIAFTTALATLLRLDGPWADAITRHAAAIEAARFVEDWLSEANALKDLGVMRRLTGDYPRATEAFREALRIYRNLGDQLGQANTLNELGAVLQLKVDFPGAAQVLEQALQIYRRLDDQLGRAGALNDLAAVRWLTDDYHGATEALEEALRIYRDLGDHLGRANALHYLGVVRRTTGDYPGATEALEQALHIYRELGNQLGQANALKGLGTVRRLTDDYHGAIEALEQALQIYRELDDRLSQADTLNNLGIVWRLTGDHPSATEAHEQALRIYRELGDRHGEVIALNDKGTLHRINEDLGSAAVCHQQALTKARAIASSREEARALQGLGRCAMAAGHTTSAQEFLRQANRIFLRIGAAEADDGCSPTIPAASSKPENTDTSAS